LYESSTPTWLWKEGWRAPFEWKKSIMGSESA
jgi:hypothetical protein